VAVAADGVLEQVRQLGRAVGHMPPAPLGQRDDDLDRRGVRAHESVSAGAHVRSARNRDRHAWQAVAARLLTCSRKVRDLLMCMASRAVLPSAPVFVERSEPARSTRLSLLEQEVPSAGAPQPVRGPVLRSGEDTAVLLLALLDRLHVTAE